jgi:adenylate kinase
MALDIVLLGAPGAGKGTQAKRLAADRGIMQVATGDILRAAVENGTELGCEAQPIMERGDLVPDAIIVGVIRERLTQPETAVGCIFDGFPRTTPQAEALDAMLPELGREIRVALLFELDEEEAVRRMLGRAAEEGRADDLPETIKRRFEVYRELTEPLSSYYRGRSLLRTIDAGGSVDEVRDQVDGIIESL